MPKKYNAFAQHNAESKKNLMANGYNNPSLDTFKQNVRRVATQNDKESFLFERFQGTYGKSMRHDNYLEALTQPSACNSNKFLGAVSSINVVNENLATQPFITEFLKIMRKQGIPLFVTVITGDGMQMTITHFIVGDLMSNRERHIISLTAEKVANKHLLDLAQDGTSPLKLCLSYQPT